MSPSLLDELDRLAEKATKREWRVLQSKYGPSWVVVNWLTTEKVFDDGSAGGEYDSSCKESDRDFIVALVNAWPEIKKRLEAAEKMTDLQEAFDHSGELTRLRAEMDNTEEELSDLRGNEAEIARLNALVEEVSQAAKQNADMHDEVMKENARLRAFVEEIRQCLDRTTPFDEDIGAALAKLEKPV